MYDIEYQYYMQIYYLIYNTNLASFYNASTLWTMVYLLLDLG